MSSNNAFKSVRNERKFHVLSSRFILLSEQPIYTQLAKADRFVVKRDPRFLNVATLDYFKIDSTPSIARRDAFSVKNDSSLLDPTINVLTIVVPST